MRALGKRLSSAVWLAEARALLTERPTSWVTIVSNTPGKLHPIEVFRTLKPYVEVHPDRVLICDGGEFAQWGQSILPAVPRRLINGGGARSVRRCQWRSRRACSNTKRLYSPCWVTARSASTW